MQKELTLPATCPWAAEPIWAWIHVQGVPLCTSVAHHDQQGNHSLCLRKSTYAWLASIESEFYSAILNTVTPFSIHQSPLAQKGETGLASYITLSISPALWTPSRDFIFLNSGQLTKIHCSFWVTSQISSISKLKGISQLKKFPQCSSEAWTLVTKIIFRSNLTIWRNPWMQVSLLAERQPRGGYNALNYFRRLNRLSWFAALSQLKWNGLDCRYISPGANFGQARVLKKQEWIFFVETWGNNHRWGDKHEVNSTVCP